MNNLLDKVGHVAQLFITFCTVVGFFAVLFIIIMMTKDLQPGTKETVLVLIGVLAGEYKNVSSYWLGSSLGSAKKDDAKKTEQAPTVTTVTQTTESVTKPKTDPPTEQKP